MFKLFLEYFVGLLAIIDPPGAVPLWISLTKSYDKPARKVLAFTTVRYVFAILVFFLFVGNGILEYFKVSLNGMRIAGGMMLIINALEFFRKPKEEDLSLADPHQEASLAFTPMAMPLLAGPGAIAVIIGIGGNIGYAWESPLKYAIAILAITCICAITLLFLNYSYSLQKIFGERFFRGLTYFMAFFLLCMGVQFILDSGSEVLVNILKSTH